MRRERNSFNISQSTTAVELIYVSSVEEEMRENRMVRPSKAFWRERRMRQRSRMKRFSIFTSTAAN